MDAEDVIIEVWPGTTLSDEERRALGLKMLVRAGIVPDSWKDTPAFMGAKYSPDQPRDEHGRFSGDGSSDSVPKVDIAEAAKTWPEATAPFRRGVAGVLHTDVPGFRPYQVIPTGHGHEADLHDIEMSKVMLRAVRDAPHTDKTLYRGLWAPFDANDPDVGKDMRELIKSSVPGATLDIPLGGFTTSPSMATSFAAGNVILQLQPGATAFDERPFSQHGESEMVSGGRFQVVDVRDNDQNEANHYLGNPYRGDGTDIMRARQDLSRPVGEIRSGTVKGPITITIKQLDTFDPDAERKSLKPSDFKDNQFWHLFLGPANNTPASEAKYSPDQPRDERGRFGEGSGSVTTTATGRLTVGEIVPHPEDANLSDVATNWQYYNDEYEMRYAAESMLGQDHPTLTMNTHVANAAAIHPTIYALEHGHVRDGSQEVVNGAYKLLAGVRDASPQELPAFRGVPLYSDEPGSRALAALKVGDTFDLSLASFSNDPDMAHSFASGTDEAQGRVVFALAPGFRGVEGPGTETEIMKPDVNLFDQAHLRGGNIVQHSTDDYVLGHQDIITGGRFQIVDVSRESVSGGKPSVGYSIKQLGTFDPDHGGAFVPNATKARKTDYQRAPFWELFGKRPPTAGAKGSPDQPRDEHGRWTSGGDSGSTSSAIVGVARFADLPPALQAKMRTKIETMTGMPFDAVTAEMRDNLGRLAAAEWKTNPGSADWYQQYHDAAVAKVAELNQGQAPGVPPMTEPKYEAMMSVTSALNDPKDNIDIVNGWSKALLADPTVHVSQEALDDYNHFAQGRDRQGVFEVNTDLQPGDYKLSELPSYMVPSMVRGLDDAPPYTLNTESLVKAVDIYRGEDPSDVIGGPKQRSFFNNLTDPSDPSSVTVDKWMYRAAIGDIPLTRDTKAYGSVTQSLGDWEQDTRFGGRVQLSDGTVTRSGATPQDFFQSGPASKANGWPGNYGVYPVVAQAIMDATKSFNDAHGTSLSPSAFQALTWAGVQR